MFVNRGWRTVEDASPYKIGGFPQAMRLFAILCRGDSRIAREAQWPSANNAATPHPFFKVLRGHPEQGKKAAPRDLDRAKKARARYEHAKLFL